MAFIDDVRAQPAVLRGVVEAYAGAERPRLDRALRLLAAEADRPLLVIGMGSSLTAGRALAGLPGRLVILEDAGELLHYGLGVASRVGVVVAVSQSGRSYETVAAVERIRVATRIPVIALVNDLDSPLARAADVALPLLAGAEANVATRTYVAAVAILLMLRDGGLTDRLVRDLARTADAMEALADSGAAEAAAAHLAGCTTLVMLGRGPSLASAYYMALTTKECSAIPAEPLSGGAFRHGPLEIAGPATGIVVFAPSGPTEALGAGIAGETADLGSPTWLLTERPEGPDARPGLLVTRLPGGLPETLGALASIVPVQLAAAELARAAGREPGVTRIATKVTDRE
jgi:glutamine---fructose-6-phosphate transaminase (isomerizing)